MGRSMQEIHGLLAERNLARLEELSPTELEVAFYRLNMVSMKERQEAGFETFYEGVYRLMMRKRQAEITKFSWA
jgi:hypothetical protein